MKNRTNWKDRLKYRLDRSLSKGPLVILGWLAAAAVLLVAVAFLAAVLIPGIDPDKQSPFEVFWDILFQALTPNPFDVTSPWPFLVIILVVTIASLFLVSILIGALTNGIEQRLDKLRRGRSKVVETGHTVILGWSHQVFSILGEILEANKERRSGAVIVVLAERDKVEMEEEIRGRFPHTFNTRIVCRTGSPMDPQSVGIVSPQTSRSVIILPPDEGNADASVIKIALALVNNHGRDRTPYNIVTEIIDPSHKKVIELISTEDNVQVILSGDLIARMMAQTSLQAGLSVVFTELLDFEGDEIYFREEKALVGKSYKEALFAYEDSCVMGLLHGDGRVSLNPSQGTLIATGDRVIALTENSQSLKLSPRSVDPAQLGFITANKPHLPAKSEKFLVLGWNEDAPLIIKELEEYGALGSEVTVVAGEEFQASVEERKVLKNLRVRFHKGKITDRGLLESLDINGYEHVLALADTKLDHQEADARTLITLLHLRDLAEKAARPSSIVSQMLDIRNRELAEETRVYDFIVSDHLTSLMLSQLSENPLLEEVFAELFDPKGSDITMKPIGDYVRTGVSVRFSTLVEAAGRMGETAIGYRLAVDAQAKEKSYGVRTNPKKSEQIVFSPEDRLIVLAPR